jgi:hypothetical protein
VRRISKTLWRTKMADPTYKITAVKPDGSPMYIKGRQFKEIKKIRKAMTSSGYANIRVFKDRTPDMLFAQGIMKETNCSSEAAMAIYKRMAKVMSRVGIELTKRGAINAIS